MPRTECRIYVGNLPPFIKTKDVEDLFYKFGKVLYVDLKQKRGAPFAFVEFKYPRDARDAISKCDGYKYEGYRLRVELPLEKGRKFGDRRNGRGSRSQYRVIVSGLPPSASWQDLKDHMRKVATDVDFAEVFKDGSGIVEFRWYNDMKYAVKKLDHSKFRSHEDETSYIRVKEDYDGRGGDGDSDRSRSRSYSPPRSRSGRRSPSYSSISGSSRSRSRSCDRR